MEHPMSNAWPAFEKKLAEMPENVNLPRDEIIRMFKSLYFLGIADAMLCVTTVEVLTEKDANRDEIRASYYLATADLLKRSGRVTVDQMIATMKAHEVK